MSNFPRQTPSRTQNINKNQGDRLYRELAQLILADIASGKYPVDSRLPAERELSAIYSVSRPTVREAVIALEVQGIVEVKLGSGAYVKRHPGDTGRPTFHASAFEITEARLLIESEAAALAATQITDEELDHLDFLVKQIALENFESKEQDAADHAFHKVIAHATRNAALERAIEDLWRLRMTSPESTLLHAKAWTANVKPVVNEHHAIVDALRTRNPDNARSAMRTHLSAVLDSLLFATEEIAIADARSSVSASRARFSRANKL